LPARTAASKVVPVGRRTATWPATTQGSEPNVYDRPVSEPATPIRVFVGSSAEGREIALNLQDQLESHNVCEVDLWEHVFEPSTYALPSLLAVAERVDFAVLIATPDDTTESRGAVRDSVRDNIILEFGLFAGALGIERTYLLSTGADVKLPSDVFGLTRLQYRHRSDGKIAPALNRAVLAIKRQIEDLGARQGVDAPQSAAAAGPSTGSETSSLSPAARPVGPPVSEAEMQEAGELVRKKRLSYSSASSFYRDFEHGSWRKNVKLSPAFESAAARKILKERWLGEADLTRSWDDSNIVFMQLELVADQLTMGDVDGLLELPTEDAHGHDQEAGLWPFLEFLEETNPSLLSDKARERLTEFKQK
jgi:predicted nucleotide-binding protein